MEPLSFAGETLTIETMVSVASLSVGLVFAYAAASKLLDVPALVAGIRAYGILPERLAPAAALSLIVAEIAIASAHLTNLGLRIVLPASILMLCVFLAVIGSLLIKGEKRPCLCFGSGRDTEVDVFSFARAALLLLIELVLYLYVAQGGAVAVGITSIGGTLAALAAAAPIVALAGWLFILPPLYRAWRAARS